MNRAPALTRLPLMALLAGRAVELRYFGASVIALGADFGCFLAAMTLGATPVLAAVLAYCVGLQVHWALSTRYVFAPDRVRQGVGRRGQHALFVGSAVVGLGITALTVALGEAAGTDPRAAKLVAVGLSFVVTFALRRAIVFRRAP
jgi:putative flippase GtrA